MGTQSNNQVLAVNVIVEVMLPTAHDIVYIFYPNHKGTVHYALLSAWHDETALELVDSQQTGLVLPLAVLGQIASNLVLNSAPVHAENPTLWCQALRRDYLLAPPYYRQI